MSCKTFEPRICKHERSRKIYNEGWCGEFKTYTLPARTIKMYGSTLNLNGGCNRCRAKLLRQIAKGQKSKATAKYEHKQSYNPYPADYHRGDFEPAIDILIDGELKASINGDYKHGMIRDSMKPYVTKVRVGRKVATLGIGEADRIISPAVNDDKTPEYQAINERREKKLFQKPNNYKRQQVLDFARDNNLVIHPGGGYEYYLNAFAKCGHCPCAKERLTCPCPESIEEVKKDGWCKCHLFWRDLGTYKESNVPEVIS